MWHFGLFFMYSWWCMAIADTWLKATINKKQESAFERTDREGLSVRVSAKGKIVFQLRYRYDKKQHRVDIGTYPLITLKNAREEAQRFKSELEKGNDPRVVKKIQLRETIDALTMEAAFRKWYQSYCISNKKNHAEIMRSYELYVFPKLGNLPLDKITTDMWMTLLEKVTKKTPSIGDRILTNSKQMMSWAARRKIIDNNPLIEINAKTNS